MISDSHHKVWDFDLKIEEEEEREGERERGKEGDMEGDRGGSEEWR